MVCSSLPAADYTGTMVTCTSGSLNDRRVHLRILMERALASTSVM